MTVQEIKEQFDAMETKAKERIDEGENAALFMNGISEAAGGGRGSDRKERF